VSDSDYAATRRQLRGVAETLIAGPQYRVAKTIRLAVRPNGFTGVAIPYSVQGTKLVWPQGRAPLTGTVGAVADAAGLEPGPPAGVYEIVDPLPPDAVLDIDADVADAVHRCLYAGGFAITKTLPQQHPVLWPEHFDVAAAQDEVTFGVSAGDDYHPLPYAYLGPWRTRSGRFWNAPFGALLGLDPTAGLDPLTEVIGDFFERGRRELGPARSLRRS
jgi:hypothetical protein